MAIPNEWALAPVKQAAVASVRNVSSKTVRGFWGAVVLVYRHTQGTGRGLAAGTSMSG